MFEYWFDSYGQAHEISKMDTEYICNCLRNLNKWLTLWRGVIPEQLTTEEMKDRNRVGMKAWFVFNGIQYIESFCAELERRKQLKDEHEE